MMELRPLGKTDILISPVAFGCWPIAGMTSLDVNDADSIKTLHAAIEHGVNFLDTAFCYGADGESERLIATALGERREELVIATKGGVHWSDENDLYVFFLLTVSGGGKFLVSSDSFGCQCCS